MDRGVLGVGGGQGRVQVVSRFESRETSVYYYETSSQVYAPLSQVLSTNLVHTQGRYKRAD